YDAATGNITSRSDLGNASGKGDFVYSSMSYGGNRADGTPIGSHALATISPLPDNFPTADLNVAYTDFKKIATLSEGTRYYALTYGVDDQRRKSEYYANGLSQGTPTLTRYYLGDYEEEVNALGNVRKIHYLSGGAMLIQNNGVDSLLYAYSDFQGSLIALADVNGNVVEKYAYDPWGARRNPADWTQKDTRTKWITNRGYTGHEHLDAFGIINMNGRVYDPATAMFMSPDPQLQSPGDWLNYNRYGYCMNNPFKYTDPSGEFWHIIIGAIIGGAINWVSNGCMFNLQGLAYLGAGMAAGAATAAAPGSAMAISAALGMANSVIGQGFDKSGNKFNIKNVEFGLNGVVGAGMMSAVTSYAGGQVGAAMHLDKVLGGISSPILRNVIGGQIGGTVIGGTFGGLSAVANGQDFGQGAWGGAKMGFVTGTIGGIGSGVQFSLDHDVNLFSGKPNPVMPKPTPPALPAHQEQLALPEHIEYPPNDGFQGEIKQDYLMPGDVVDRIGEVGPDSRFLSTKSSSVEMRSLAPNTNTSVYNQYMVAKPIPVTSGKIAPWFNQPGGGLQFRTTVPINTLINRGFLIKF
ncbi:MAG TPA: glycohydrolase toxin TNT-related protein, partial [Paludibacter sp.]|nr:glycohydrolase toxin TNT-related protein [Paludibacter sp.]